MLNGIGLLLGISVLWLGLSMLFNGVNTLVLPNRLVGVTTEANKATTLGEILLDRLHHLDPPNQRGEQMNQRQQRFG